MCKRVAESAYCSVLNHRCRSTTTSQFLVQEVKRYIWRTYTLSNLLIITSNRAESLLLDACGKPGGDLGQYCLAAGGIRSVGSKWRSVAHSGIDHRRRLHQRGQHLCTVGQISHAKCFYSCPVWFSFTEFFHFLANEHTAWWVLIVFSCRHETYRDGTMRAIQTCSSVLRNTCSKVTFACSILTLHIWRYTTFQHLHTLCEVMYRPAD